MYVLSTGGLPVGALAASRALRFCIITSAAYSQLPIYQPCHMGGSLPGLLASFPCQYDVSVAHFGTARP